MIRFACPRCKAVLEQPEGVAGTQFSCPSCGQRLEAPKPAEAKLAEANRLPQVTSGHRPEDPAAMPPPPIVSQPYVTASPERPPVESKSEARRVGGDRPREERPREERRPGRSSGSAPARTWEDREPPPMPASRRPRRAA